MNDYPFGNFLYELRTEKRLSQDELGEMLGVSNKAVSKWEMGVSKPRPAMLLRLSEIFGVTIEELLRGKREEKQESLNEDGEELSTAFNEQIKALRKLRKSLLASIVSWVLSIIAIAATVTISQALYNDIVGWAVVFLCIFLFSYFASFIWVIAFAVSLRKRKRLLHKSFPKHTKELNDKSVIKNQKVSFFVFFFYS